MNEVINIRALQILCSIPLDNQQVSYAIAIYGNLACARHCFFMSAMVNE